MRPPLKHPHAASGHHAPEKETLPTSDLAEPGVRRQRMNPGVMHSDACRQRFRPPFFWGTWTKLTRSLIFLPDLC